MSIELTQSQQQQLDLTNERPVAVHDPRSKTDYVLVPKEQYEQMLEIVEDDAEQRALQRAASRSLAAHLGRARMKPGELYYADLYEAGIRPVLIVSRESLNRGGYAVAVPLTSSHFEHRSKLPNCIPFRSGQFGLTKDCVAQCEAILSIERAQIDAARGLIGQVDEDTMRQIIRAVGYVIASECEPS